MEPPLLHSAPFFLNYPSIPIPKVGIQTDPLSQWTVRSCVQILIIFNVSDRIFISIPIISEKLL